MGIFAQSLNEKENPANSSGPLVLLLPRTLSTSMRPARWLPRSNTELDADARAAPHSAAVALSASALENRDDAGFIDAVFNGALGDVPLGQ